MACDTRALEPSYTSIHYECYFISKTENPTNAHGSMSLNTALDHKCDSKEATLSGMMSC